MAPGRLTADHNGFSERALFGRTTAFAWSEIESFSSDTSKTLPLTVKLRDGSSKTLLATYRVRSGDLAGILEAMRVKNSGAI